MDHRVAFDFEIEFTNGGGLQGQDFRLDVPSEDVTDQWVADALVRDLRLLMVGEVRIRNRRVFEEPHKRGLEPAPSDGAASAARLVVDLSHPIVEGMTTYPGLPVPEIRPHLTREASTAHYAPGVTFAIDVITLCGNTGTYVDSPFHRLADGQDLAELPLERLVNVPAVRVDVTGTSSRAVDAPALLPYDLAGRAVLIHTGHDRHWGTDAYGRDNPFLTRPPPICSSSRAPRWSGSIRSTSTIRPTLLGRRTRGCWRLASRSVSTSRTSRRSRSKVPGSARSPPRSMEPARSRFARWRPSRTGSVFDDPARRGTIRRQ